MPWKKPGDVYKNRGFLLRNLVGNWAISPIYTCESPEYATALSGANGNLNGDSGSAIGRPFVNPLGVKGTGSGVIPQYSTNPTLVASYLPMDGGQCARNLAGYIATNPNGYHVQSVAGTLPTAGHNTLPINPINNADLAAYKKFTVREQYGLEFGAQAFNVLNHAQYIPGTVDHVNATSYTASYNYQTVTNAFFNQPQKQFTNNARTMQISKISFQVIDGMVRGRSLERPLF